jgi:hypothetical protein
MVIDKTLSIDIVWQTFLNNRDEMRYSVTFEGVCAVPAELVFYST